MMLEGYQKCVWRELKSSFLCSSRTKWINKSKNHHSPLEIAFSSVPPPVASVCSEQLASNIVTCLQELFLWSCHYKSPGGATENPWTVVNTGRDDDSTFVSLTLTYFPWLSLYSPSPTQRPGPLFPDSVLPFVCFSLVAANLSHDARDQRHQRQMSR